MTPEDKLSAFFAEATPPARDLGFQAMVAETIARRRAIATVVALIPWTIAAIALCWGLGTVLVPLAEGLGHTLGLATSILGLTALSVAASLDLGRRLSPI